MQIFKLHGNNACVCIRALGVGVGGPTRLALKDSIEIARLFQNHDKSRIGFNYRKNYQTCSVHVQGYRHIIIYMITNYLVHEILQRF